MRSTVRGSGLAAALVFLGVLLAPAAGAHVRSSDGFSEVRSRADGSVQYRLSLEHDLLLRAVGADAVPARASDAARRASLTAARAQIASYVLPRIDVLLDGVACEPALAGTDVERLDGRPYARLDLRYDCPGDTDGSYQVDYGVFAEADAVVDDHKNIVDYDLGGHASRTVLDARNSSLVAGSGGAVGLLGRFAELGIEHIYAGADHLLFVAALLLGASTLGSVLRVVSAFTVAHSVTLALAVVGWIDVPSEVVEPLIALSIAYVAIEGALGAAPRRRLAVVFAFGLLHGLGFASALRFTDELSWQLVGSLVSFNLGIEIGQAALIALLFPVLVLTRRFQWAPMAYAGATAAVALMGLGWFVQRISFT